MSVVYNGTYYYYVTDLQGDVVAIVDTAGVKVVEYLYDAWGRLLITGGTKATDLCVHNPLRYRGYVYDPETGLYYLQSRYYNPTLGRFLSSDIVYDTDAGLQGFNLFLYCGNNPTNRIDASGKDSKDLIDGDKEDDTYHDHSGGHSGETPPALPSTTPAGGNANAGKQIPNDAWQMKEYLETHNGTPPKGYKGGKVFNNDQRDGGQLLPVDDAPYREYDIHPHVSGVRRGTERIVIRISGTAWYTSDHYITFVLMV